MLKLNENLKKIIILFFVSLCSLFFALFIWDKINLPISKSIAIVTAKWPLTEGYHTQNDTVRFFVYILISLIPFLFFFNKFFVGKIYSINNFFKLKTNNLIIEKKNSLNYFFYFLLFLISLQFFLIDFTWFVGPIDIFHEGVQLTPSNNYEITGGLWSTSFLERGLFGNLFPALLWFFSDINSIGITRFGTLLLTLTNKILLIILAKQISENINFKEIEKILFFLFLSIIFISFTDYFDPSHFSRRFTLYILFFNILISVITAKNKFTSSSVFLGLVSILSFFWWLDIAIYINVTLALLLFFYLYRADYYKFYSILIGIFVGLILLLIFIPLAELKIFLTNTYLVTQSIEIVGSLKYPSPLFDGDGRATKTLIFFSLTGTFLTITCLIKNNKINNNLKIFFLFYFIASLISFKYGLTRSDGPHIKAGSATMLTILSFLFVYYFFYIFSIFNAEKYLFNFKNYIYLILLISLAYNFNISKINLLSDSVNKIRYLINADQNNFLTHHNSDYKKLVKYYKKITLNENCIQILTDEIAIPYLVNKKSCSKFNIMELLHPKKMQLQFIDELKLKRPKVILYRSEKFTFGNGESLKLVNKYIEENYTFHSKIDYWTFVKIIK